MSLRGATPRSNLVARASLLRFARKDRRGAFKTPFKRVCEKPSFVIAIYHAPVERHLQIKMVSPRLMVRQARHERVPGPFVLSWSQGERLFSEKRSDGI